MKIKQTDQDPPARVRVALQELVEGALRQQHRLRESRKVEPKNFFDTFVDRLDARAVDFGHLGISVDPDELRFVSAAALLQAASDPVPGAVHTEIKRDLQVRRSMRDQ